MTGVSEADLRDNGRLDELLRRAVSQRVGRFAGVDPADERTRLAWYAMAEHCLRLGDSPAALFAANVSKDLAFGWISDDDEQRALARLKPRRKPAPEPRAPAAAARVRPVLSTDARWVKEAMALAHRNGTAAWPLLERRGWDRDRYEAALRQLKGAGCI